MIIKILEGSYPVKARGNEPSFQGWWMCDIGANAIELHELSSGGEGQSDQLGNPNGVNMRICMVKHSAFDPSKPTRGKCIEYQDDEGNWNSILFNTTAFVCNDRGQTIEIIHG